MFKNYYAPKNPGLCIAEFSNVVLHGLIYGLGVSSQIIRQLLRRQTLLLDLKSTLHTNYTIVFLRIVNRSKSNCFTLIVVHTQISLVSEEKFFVPSEIIFEVVSRIPISKISVLVEYQSQYIFYMSPCEFFHIFCARETPALI